MGQQENKRLDVAAQMAKVTARARRARPWRAIIALILAIAAIVAVKWLGVPLHAAEGICRAGQLTPDRSCAAGFHPGKLITIAGTAAFLLFGVVAALGLSGKARQMLEPAVGAAHAAVVRYALVLIGAIAIFLTTLNLVDVSVGQLIVGGALTGVLIGIAAQQALSNVFAGLMLMFARPFSVGDKIWIRSGALSGTLEGTVLEISITYVRLDTTDGLLLLPNSQVLAAVIGPARKPAAQPGSLAAWQPGNPPAGQLAGPDGAGGPAGQADGQAGPADGRNGQPDGNQAGPLGGAAGAAGPKQDGQAGRQQDVPAEPRPDGQR